MEYTIFEHLQMPHKGMRFFTTYNETEKDSDWHKIVGHANSVKEAQEICDAYDENYLPSIDDVRNWYIADMGEELAKFEMYNYMFARNSKFMHD